MAAERGLTDDHACPWQKLDREAVGSPHNDRADDAGWYSHTPDASEATARTRCALSIWCCDMARIPEAFLSRPHGERTAAALLPLWDPGERRKYDELVGIVSLRV
jgi:hypothetical protein